MRYSDVVFADNTLLWLTNALASVIRGAGVMLFPFAVICFSVVVLIPLSPMFIFGFGPLPALGVAGGGVAIVFTTALVAVPLAWYVVSSAGIVRLRRAKLRWSLFADILRVGGVGALNTLAARTSADPARVRPRSAAGGDCGRQYRPTAASASACRSISPRKARAGSAGRLSPACCAWASPPAAARSR